MVALVEMNGCDRDCMVQSPKAKNLLLGPLEKVCGYLPYRLEPGRNKDRSCLFIHRWQMGFSSNTNAKLNSYLECSVENDSETKYGPKGKDTSLEEGDYSGLEEGEIEL